MKNFISLKSFLFVVGFILIIYSIFEHFSDHQSLYLEDVFLLSVFVITLYTILAFTHKHYNKKDGVRGIVLAEFIHSLVDGLTIGMSFIISPTAGFAALLAVISHEIPKITGTFLLIKSIVDNTLETIKYTCLSLLGIPLVAFSILFLGEKIGAISEDIKHLIELISVATLIVILVRIASHLYSHRGHDHAECNNCKNK